MLIIFVKRIIKFLYAGLLKLMPTLIGVIDKKSSDIAYKVRVYRAAKLGVRGFRGEKLQHNYAVFR